MSERRPLLALFREEWPKEKPPAGGQASGRHADFLVVTREVLQGFRAATYPPAYDALDPSLTSFLGSEQHEPFSLLFFCSLAPELLRAHTPHEPPFFEQCLHELQVLHALQFAEPVQVAADEYPAKATNRAAAAMKPMMGFLTMNPLVEVEAAGVMNAISHLPGKLGERKRRLSIRGGTYGALLWDRIGYKAMRPWRILLGFWPVVVAANVQRAHVGFGILIRLLPPQSHA